MADVRKTKERKRTFSQSAGSVCSRDSPLPGVAMDEKTEDDNRTHKIFVRGITRATTSAILRDHFRKFGLVTAYQVKKDSETRRSRGFGFVTMGSVIDVDDIMKAQPHIIDGRCVDVQRAVPRDETMRTYPSNKMARLFVGGLHQNTLENELRNYFSRYGIIDSVSIPRDHMTGRHRGFAFVEFEDIKVVDKVVARSRKNDDELRFDTEWFKERPKEHWVDRGPEPRHQEKLGSVIRRHDNWDGYGSGSGSSSVSTTGPGAGSVPGSGSGYGRSPAGRGFDQAYDEMGRYNPHESNYRPEKSWSFRNSAGYASDRNEPWSSACNS
uniref:heterogeneous nuclear ribonucleoproteins A2/B1-like isoform X2 n=1 Tax=Myxine glutinosa TaxID=7769 RepID=UPI00358E565B